MSPCDRAWMFEILTGYSSVPIISARHLQPEGVIDLRAVRVKTVPQQRTRPNGDTMRCLFQQTRSVIVTVIW